MLQNWICILILIKLSLGAQFSAHATEEVRGELAEKVNASDSQSVFEDLALSLSYAFNTDLADQLEPRLYTHSLSFYLSYNFAKKLQAFYSFGFLATTVGNKVQEDQDQRFIGTGTSNEIGLSGALTSYFNHKLNWYTSLDFPTDETSRLEGYRAIVHLGLNLRSSYYSRRLILANDVDYTYLVNTYKVSASGESNPESFFSYKLGGRWIFQSGISMGLGFGIKTTRQFNDLITYSYNNSQFISYTYKKVNFSLSHANGGFTDQGDVLLWYVDKYRRLISFSLSYSF